MVRKTMAALVLFSKNQVIFREISSRTKKNRNFAGLKWKLHQQQITIY